VRVTQHELILPAVVGQIEKDLMRTFPSNHYFNNMEVGAPRFADVSIFSRALSRG
jgi:hypothetical protein